MVLGNLGSGLKRGNSTRKTVTAGIRAGDYSLILENKGAEDWPVLTLYLNGTPPFTYNVSIEPLKPGQTMTIPLSKFSTDGGKRFDPSAFRVTEVWIGGGGFDYARFAF